MARRRDSPLGFGLCGSSKGRVQSILQNKESGREALVAGVFELRLALGIHTSAKSDAVTSGKIPLGSPPSYRLSASSFEIAFYSQQETHVYVI